MKSFVLTMILLLPAVLWSGPASATFGLQKLFTAHYPSVAKTQLDSCTTCHTPVVKDSLNSYGLALRTAALAFEAIEEADSDSDGKSNFNEIQSLGLPGSQATPDELFIITNKRGTINFDHGKHSIGQEYLLTDGKCASCHGPDRFPKLFNDAESMKELAHGLCLGCHKESNKDKAPRKCNDCHARER
jgi:hypothetical protein